MNKLKFLFVLCTFFLLQPTTVKAEVWPSGMPKEIAGSDFTDFNDAHSYYVFTLGNACIQCHIPPSYYQIPGVFGSTIRAHGAPTGARSQQQISSIGGSNLYIRGGGTGYNSSKGSYDAYTEMYDEEQPFFVSQVPTPVDRDDPNLGALFGEGVLGLTFDYDDVQERFRLYKSEVTILDSETGARVPGLCGSPAQAGLGEGTYTLYWLEPVDANENPISGYQMKAVGEDAWWMLFEDTDNLVVNGTSNTYNWKAGKSTLKSKYGEYKEYCPGQHAWSGYEQKIAKAYYGQTMKNIGAATFSNLCNLEFFYYAGEDCSEIGKAAFFDCHVMEEHCLESNVRIVNTLAFAQCSSLEHVHACQLRETYGPTIHVNPCDESKLRCIGNRAFMNTPLNEFDFPPEVKTVGKEAFSGCSKMKFIQWNSRTIRIGDRAFDGCKSLGRRVVAYLPKYLKLGKDCFRNCM